jgi:hypothetical protein
MNGSMQIVTPEGPAAAFDAKSHAQAGITFPHWKAHQGELCTATNKNADADTAKPAYWLVKPQEGKSVHLQAVVSASGAGEAMLFENPVTLPQGGIAAFTLIDEIRQDIQVHAALLNRHLLVPGAGYPPAKVLEAKPTTVAELITMTNYILLFYKLHDADMAAAVPVYHSAQGTAHALDSEVEATTLAEAVDLLNDIKAKFNLHEAEAVGHQNVGTVAADQIAAADSTLGDTSEEGAPFALNFRNKLSVTTPLLDAFYVPAEVYNEGTQKMVLQVPGGGAGANKFGGNTKEGAEIIVDYPSSALIKFLPDADNAKAWIVVEYYDVNL